MLIPKASRGKGKPWFIQQLTGERHRTNRATTNGSRVPTFPRSWVFETRDLELSAMFSRFCLQLLSIQGFCPGSPANNMIPEDHTGRGIPFFARGLSYLGSSQECSRPLISCHNARFSGVGTPVFCPQSTMAPFMKSI